MAKEEKTEINKIIYTSREFFDLERELEKYAIDKEQDIKGVMTMVHYVPVEGLKQWYIDNGGLSDYEEWTVLDISRFKELQDKMEQFNSWQNRREYAKKKELEDYDKMIDHFDINKEKN